MQLPHPIPAIINIGLKGIPRTYLGAVELGLGVLVGIVGRDVDKSVNVVLGHGVRDAL